MATTQAEMQNIWQNNVALDAGKVSVAGMNYVPALEPQQTHPGIQLSFTILHLSLPINATVSRPNAHVIMEFHETERSSVAKGAKRDGGRPGLMVRVVASKMLQAKSVYGEYLPRNSVFIGRWRLGRQGGWGEADGAGAWRPFQLKSEPTTQKPHCLAKPLSRHPHATPRASAAGRFVFVQHRAEKPLSLWSGPIKI